MRRDHILLVQDKEDANYMIVVGIVGISTQLFYQSEEVHNKAVIDLSY